MMKKSLMCVLLVLCAFCNVFAKDYESDACYAMSKTEKLTLKYKVGATGETNFMKLRLIKGSDDVLQSGDKIIFLCYNKESREIDFDATNVSQKSEDEYHLLTEDSLYLSAFTSGVKSITLVRNGNAIALTPTKYSSIDIAKGAQQSLSAAYSVKFARLTAERKQAAYDAKMAQLAQEAAARQADKDKRELAKQVEAAKREAYKDSVELAQQAEKVAAKANKESVALANKSAKSQTESVAISSHSTGEESSSLSWKDGYNRVNFGYNATLISSLINIPHLDGFTAGYTRGFHISKKLPIYIEAGAQLVFGTGNVFKERANHLRIAIPVSVTYRFTVTEAIKLSPYTGFALAVNVLDKYIGKSLFGGENGASRVQGEWHIGLNANYNRFMLGLEYGLDMNKFSSDMDIKSSHVAVNFGYEF